MCCRVPIETCRRRTAPHWRQSTANTSTSKPNCDCWRSSSAKETQQSSSENKVDKYEVEGQIQVSICADYFFSPALTDESVNPFHWALNGFFSTHGEKSRFSRRRDRTLLYSVLNNAHLSSNHNFTANTFSLNVFIGTKAIFCVLL